MIFALFHSCHAGKDDGNDILPDVEFSETDGRTDIDDSGITINGVSGLNFKSNETMQSVRFENPETNNCSMVISLYLSDGTQIYDSGFLYPGDYTDTICLQRQLQRGVYSNAIILYRCYTNDESHKPMSQCEFPIEIMSL